MYYKEKDTILQKLKQRKSAFESSSKDFVNLTICETKDDFQELINQFSTALELFF